MTKRAFFSTLVLISGFFVVPMVADANKPGATQGFSECVEMCYIRECGEGGYKCPTVTQKRMYRRLCNGRCQEQMRRQEEERKLAVYNRQIELERERAQRAREEILLKHRLWKERVETKQRIQKSYEEAKRNKRVAESRQLYRKMKQAHQQELSALREQLQHKEKFLLSRANVRTTESKKAEKQIAFLKDALARAEKDRDEARAKALKEEMNKRVVEKKDNEKKAKAMQVQYLETKVKRHDTDKQSIQVQKEQINVDKEDAQKKNDRERLRELARRLGALAGKQAALEQKQDADRKKLEEARMTLTSTSTTAP